MNPTRMYWTNGDSYAMDGSEARPYSRTVYVGFRIPDKLRPVPVTPREMFIVYGESVKTTRPPSRKVK